MKNIVENYNSYLKVKDKVFTQRFTWGGLSGKYPKYTTNIIKFNVETNAFSTMKKCYTTVELFTETDKLAKKYVEWVKSKGKAYSKEECDDMRNFFIGAIGEDFFGYVLSEVKCVIAPNASGVLKRYDFTNVSPNLDDSIDLGVDLYANVNDIPSVIQVKFHNPFAKSVEPWTTIVQKAYAEGTSMKIIDGDVPENIFVCFLGNENTTYSNLKKARNYQKNVVAIGRNALGNTIDNRLKESFWDKFYEHLCSIK